MKRIIRAIIRRMCWCVFFFFPIKKNRILFSSFYGRGYGDNLKYICNELEGCGYDIGWVVKDRTEEKTLPSFVKPIYKDSIKHIFYLATSNIWVDNCRKPFRYKKNKQFYIQTWHGGGAQKKCEADAIDKISLGYVKTAKKDSKYADLFISESGFMTKLYFSSFWYSGPVYQCGYPRYDILLATPENIKKKVYSFFKIDEKKKIVLYAPTFRKNHSFEAYNIDFVRLQRVLYEKYKQEYVILVHLHPNVATYEGIIKYDGINIFNATFYPDTQELLAASDFLIGDYSSINYDFSLKKLPVIRFVSDLEEYNEDRGTYFRFSDYPYPYAVNNDELEKLILNFDNEKYLGELQLFFDRLQSVMNANSSKDIANLIVSYVNINNKKIFLKKYKDKFILKDG